MKIDDRQQQKEQQARADLTQRLREKLREETEFIGKVLTGDKQPESKSEEC